jgi:hypothetical protein
VAILAGASRLEERILTISGTPDRRVILAGASRVEERILTMSGTSGAICPIARPVGRSFAPGRMHSDDDHSGRNLPDRVAILARFVHALIIPTFA